MNAQCSDDWCMQILSCRILLRFLLIISLLLLLLLLLLLAYGCVAVCHLTACALSLSLSTDTDPAQANSVLLSDCTAERPCIPLALAHPVTAFSSSLKHLTVICRLMCWLEIIIIQIICSTVQKTATTFN